MDDERDGDRRPPYVERVLDLPALIRKKSHFLFGARQTGKSFLIRHRKRGAAYDPDGRERPIDKLRPI